MVRGDKQDHFKTGRLLARAHAILQRFFCTFDPDIEGTMLPYNGNHLVPPFIGTSTDQASTKAIGSILGYLCPQLRNIGRGMRQPLG